MRAAYAAATAAFACAVPTTRLSASSCLRSFGTNGSARCTKSKSGSMTRRQPSSVAKLRNADASVEGSARWCLRMTSSIIVKIDPSPRGQCCTEVRAIPMS
ncbi:hypothetical protein ACFPRL_02470 [Pseudoclavibacter helvolus]